MLVRILDLLDRQALPEIQASMELEVLLVPRVKEAWMALQGPRALSDHVEVMVLKALEALPVHRALETWAIVITKWRVLPLSVVVHLQTLTSLSKN